jgi:3-dehydroquinate synthetase
MKIISDSQIILTRYSGNTRIITGIGLLDKLDIFIDSKNKPSNILLLSDVNTFELFGTQTEKSLNNLHVPVVKSIIPPGEKSKNLQSLAEIILPFLKKGLSHNSMLIALGGGVVCDLGGFIASILLRGIRSVYIPTTLLAQIDAAIGGKTGVNYVTPNNVMYKNMIGTFHQPEMVISDVNTLVTLPERELRSGLGEMVKYYVGWGHPTIKQLSSTSTQGVEREKVAGIISLCQKIKITVIKNDPFEIEGSRQQLNLGHTIGHAIESAAAGKLTHGEAVAVGLSAAVKISDRLSFINSSKARNITATISSLGLPVNVKNLNINEVLRAMAFDKKCGTFVLIRDIGKLIIGKRVDNVIVRNVLEEICL